MCRHIKTLVLDEADEMLAKDFKDQIYDIYRYLPPETQVMHGTGRRLRAWAGLLLSSWLLSHVRAPSPLLVPPLVLVPGGAGVGHAAH